MPEPIAVRAAFTSMMRPECGHVAKENRRKQAGADGFEMEEFECVACGYEAHADENAARIIAIKGAWLTNLPTKKERAWTEMPDELNFEAFVKNCAERRKGGPAAARLVPL